MVMPAEFTQFRADHVDNAAVRTVHSMQCDSEFGVVRFHLLDLRGGDRIGNRDIERSCRNRVIDRGKSLIGAADFQSALAQAIEGLRRGDFADKVQVNVKHGGKIGLLSDNVRVPDFLE